jgi:hypothetical protein
VEPKVVHAVIKDKLNDNDELWFSDWIFATPGRYELWFILFDRQIGKHNIAKRRVQVRQLQSDALPHLGERLPQLEFPRVSDREGGSVLGLYGNLNLPVQNKQKASIELIPIVNHFETRPSRKSVRDHSQKIVAIINTLSQMRVADGSISFTAVDVTGRQIPFQRVASDRLNWADLFQVLVNANELETVSKRDVLAESNSADFLWQTINEQLTGCNESVRVLLIVGSALGHEQSKSEFPTLPSDCKSRIFYYFIYAWMVVGMVPNYCRTYRHISTQQRFTFGLLLICGKLLLPLSESWSGCSVPRSVRSPRIVDYKPPGTVCLTTENICGFCRQLHRFAVWPGASE